jgi:uncharacterized membrane protein YbaN (DUF454 family)
MSKIHHLLAFSMGMMDTMEVNQKQWQDDILKKWDESKKYPRKKKKRVRKELLVDWAIASWSPFDDLGNW